MDISGSVAYKFGTHKFDLTLGRATAHVRLAGEIDSASAADLTRLLASLDRLFSMTVEVDLAGVTFLDTAGVHPLIEATRRRESAALPALVIGECSRPARYLLDVAGLGGSPGLSVQAWDQLPKWSIQ